MTVPDLPAVEAYHPAVSAAIPAGSTGYTLYEHENFRLHRTLADLAVDGLRHHRLYPNSLDACRYWSVLTGIGATYGVLVEVGT